MFRSHLYRTKTTVMKKIVLLAVFVALVKTGSAQITATPSFLCFSAAVGDTSVPQAAHIFLSGFDTIFLAFSAPPGFQISRDDTNWTSSIPFSSFYCSSMPFDFDFDILVRFLPTVTGGYYDTVHYYPNASVSFSIPVIGNGVCPTSPPPLPATYVSDSFSATALEFCDSIQVISTIPSPSPGHSVRTVFTDGSSSVSVPFSSDTAITAHHYACPGYYTLKQVLYNGVNPVDSLHFSHNYISCNTVPLQFYYDGNNNCTYDYADYALSSPVLVRVDSNGVPVDTISATAGFNYIAQGVSGDEYSFRVISAPPGLSVTCPSSDSLSITLPNTAVSTLRFGFYSVTTVANDWSVTDYIGHSFTKQNCQHGIISPRYQSYCDPFPSGTTIKLTYSPKYVLSDASLPLLSSYANIATFDLSGISNSGNNPFSIYYDLAPRTTPLLIGDTVHSEVQIFPFSGDVDTLNNTMNLIDTVVAGYDPNEISVSPSYCIPVTSGTSILTYSIGFENTGTDTAFNVTVLDTLSTFIDPTSLRLESASAPMYTTIATDGSGHHILKFDFPAINLLDSSHHNACSGLVQFSVRTRPGLTDGTLITNEAGIYFDYNPVVMTNKVTNRVGCPTAVPEIGTAKSKVRLYPNPVSQILVLEANGFDHAIITNVVGQKLQEVRLANAQTSVDVSNLPGGVYFVTVCGESGQETLKFVKN